MEFHVIDDERFFREFLTAVVRECGHDVVAFDNGVEYLDYLISVEPDNVAAIFLDDFMPGMRGYDLVPEIRRHLPDQRIVMVSGSPAAEFSNENGLCEYLLKPVRPEALFSLIDDLISSFEAEQAPDPKLQREVPHAWAA